MARVQGRTRYDSKDVGGRAKQEARAENEAGAGVESNAGTIAEGRGSVACVPRLDLDHCESQFDLLRLIQRLLKQQIQLL